MSDRSHPEDEQLVQLAAGEPDGSDVSRHVALCAECQEHIAELLGALDGYSELHRALKRSLPPPPKPWRDLGSQIEQYEHSRRKRVLRFPGRVWLATAAAATLMAGIVWRFERPAKVVIGEPPKPALPPSVAVMPPAPARPERPALGPADELHAMAALHSIGADLGEPIELNRDRSHLTVTATGLDDHRRRELENALAGIPALELRFEQPRATHLNPSETTPVTPPASPDSALQDLVQRLGSQTAANDFINRVLDTSEAAMSRAFALRALARRFPPEVSSQLNAADAAVLANLRRDHREALATQIRRLHELLASVFEFKTTVPANRSADIDNLFVATQRLDQLLNQTFAGSEPGASGRLADLASALAEVEAQLKNQR